MKDKLIGGVVIIIAIGLLFLAGFGGQIFGTPIEAYQVSVKGEVIGNISSRDELYNLIDTEQSELKEKYKVSKVYPPDSLTVQKVYTYDSKIRDVKDVYDQIKETEHFTIEGYVVSIKYTDEVLGNSDESEDTVKKDDLILYVLDKEIVKPSLYNVATSFIGTEDLKAFEEYISKNK